SPKEKRRKTHQDGKKKYANDQDPANVEVQFLPKYLMDGKVLTVDDSALKDGCAALNLRLNSHLPKDLAHVESLSDTELTRRYFLSSEKHALMGDQIVQRFYKYSQRLQMHQGKSCTADGPDIAYFTSRISALEMENNKHVTEKLEVEANLKQALSDHAVTVENLQNQIIQITNNLNKEKAEAVKALDEKMTSKYYTEKARLEEEAKATVKTQKDKYLQIIRQLEDKIKKRTPAIPRTG
ncbi:hypothetical protein FRX31_015474, partial [Thalictrum thalictroides]